MAKKGNSFLKFAAISALAAGAYYLYKKSSTEIAVDMEDDDDVEGFDEDLDGEVKPEKRPYVSLDFNTASQKVQDVAGKVADVAEKAATSIGNIIKMGEERVEEFFDDRKTAEEPECCEETAEETTMEECAEECSEATSEESETPAEGSTSEEVFF